ncbi:MAG: hypothetical protein ABJD13_21380 [Paracoccaceae bacterium]
MFNRRTFLTLAAGTLLAACSQAPLLSPGAAEGVRIRSVSVDVSGFEGVTGREFNVTADQLQADVLAELRKQLAPSGEGTADVAVSISSVQLVSPGAAFAFGGPSRIAGVVQITNTESGEFILPATEVVGLADGTYVPGGVIAALATKNPENDYKNTVASFASDIKRRLFGAEK